MPTPALTITPCPDPADHPRLVEVWLSAVRATHHFLTPADIESYRTHLIPDYFPQVTLYAARRGDEILGFSGLAGGSLEMLFVHNNARGTGVGSALLAHALTHHPALTLDVNEQNPAALGFYRARGFTETGRSETDGDGRPFPIIHLRYAPHE